MNHRDAIQRAVGYESFLVAALIATVMTDERRPLLIYIVLAAVLLALSIWVTDALGSAAVLLPILPFAAAVAHLLSVATGPSQYTGIGVLYVGLIWLGTEGLVVVGLLCRLWRWTGMTD